MIIKLLDSIRTQSLVRFPLNQLIDKIDPFFRPVNIPRVDLNLRLDNRIPDVLPGSTQVRSLSHDTFVKNDSQGKEVNFVGVILMKKNLRSHVTRSTRGILHIVNLPLFTDPKVSQPQVTLFLKDNIFRFDVPVDETLPMDVIQGLHQTGCKKLDLIFIEGLLDTHVEPEVSSSRKVHQQIEIIFVLKRGLFIDDKFVVQLVQNLVLIHDRID